jgi:flagella basal body P-ring formation protein FlgA
MIWALIGCAALLLSDTAAAAGRITQAEVHQAVERFVRAELDGRPAEERIEVRTRWQNDILLGEEGPLKIRVRRLSGRPLRGPTVLRLEIVAQERVVREVAVTADVRWFSQVLVAVRGLRRGEELSAEMVERDERDVTRERDGFFTAAAELAGLRVRRTVRAGDPLTRSHTERVPAVLRGGEITMVVVGGNLRISARGTALQNGGIGDRIRVRNADSGKVVYGKVVGSSTVRMGF